MWTGVESGFYDQEGKLIVITALVFLSRESESFVWSEPLECPISKLQRRNNIIEATLKWKKQHWEK